MRALRQLLLLLLATTMLRAVAVRAWDAQPDGYEVIDGPASANETAQWRRDWETWRRMELAANRYDAADACSAYNAPALAWTQRSPVQAVLLLTDRAVFDRARDAFTVDAYVRGMEARVGKLDSVLLWPAYPNIGVDARSQWGLLRSLPGGLRGLRALVAQFHARDVRVLLPYNPWDTATRAEPGREDAVRMYTADIATLGELVAAVGADGFNGDTMYGVPRAFYDCSRPVAAAPEGGVPTALLASNPMSWGYLLGSARFPPLARAKFLEPRHMVQVCARWSLDRVADIQAAFFNGAGYVVWENVWGIWNAMTARESESARRAFAVLRAFAFATTSRAWQPFFDGLAASDSGRVFASEFPIDDGRAGWFYTVISTAEEPATARLPLRKHLERLGRVRVYDAYHGVELQPRGGGDHGGDSADALTASVSFSLEPRGFGAVYVAPADGAEPHARPANLSRFLAEMRAMTATPLRSFSAQRALLQQTLVDSRAAEPTPARAARWPIDAARWPIDAAASDHGPMVRVRGADNWWFNVTGVQIEPVPAWTPDWPQLGAGVQFPWETRPWNNHSARLLVHDFWIDRFPVTNAAFARFLRQSRYVPQSLDRFLEHWDNRRAREGGGGGSGSGSGSGNRSASTAALDSDGDAAAYTPLDEWRVPPALAQSPVVNVAREDAEAFAAFYGQRLPHDWEWQYVAANGDAHSAFPWGDEYDAARVPAVARSADALRPPPAVGSHPRSQSTAFGVHDLVGLVWQMTDRFCDAHTCGLLLRGGSYFRPVAATHSDPNWYFPQALRAQQHNRFLMLSQSYDRSPLVGFRCARSARAGDDRV